WGLRGRPAAAARRRRHAARLRRALLRAACARRRHLRGARGTRRRRAGRPRRGGRARRDVRRAARRAPAVPRGGDPRARAVPVPEARGRLAATRRGARRRGGGGARVRLAVITSGFPRTSETFVLNELLALDAHGLLGPVFATKPGDGSPLQPGAE